jgi:hypothetical protein
MLFAFRLDCSVEFRNAPICIYVWDKCPNADNLWKSLEEFSVVLISLSSR